MSLRRNIRSAYSLKLADWWHLLQAWWLLLLIDCGLRWLSFITLQKLLRTNISVVGEANKGEIQLILHDYVLMVDRAARHHLYPMTCLRQALALQKLLILNGISTQLRFGVRKISGNLEAHAWVEYDGKLVGKLDHIQSQFVPLNQQRSDNTLDTISPN